MRRFASFGLLLALALAPSCSRPRGARAVGHPVILISVDTLRSDRLGPYGGQVATPAIDTLARDAILFVRAYSHCPITLPSHSSILTGLLPPQHGVRNNKGYVLEDRFETLAERLEKAGYRTGGFVSSMVLRKGTGIEQGFETWDEPEQPLRGKGSRVFAQRRGDRTAARAEAWLDSLPSGAKPFLFLHLYDPHTPYDAPEPYTSRYPSAYDAEVAWVDHVLGGFLDDLRHRGLYDRSLIVFLSDHGEGLGDHVEKEHGVFLYREDLQVPLMIKLPGGSRAGERVEEPVALEDVAPTLLAALELPREGLPGRPLLAPGEPPADRVLYAESLFGLEQYGWSPLRSAIQGRLHFVQAPRPELYDLERDPGETKNLLPGRAVPAALANALLAIGKGIRSTRAVSPEDAERLAALGYVGGPSADEPPEGNLPDPKDGIGAAMELWSLMDQVGKTSSAAPEMRIVEILGGLHMHQESLSRTVALNLLRAGRAEAARKVLQPFSQSPDPGTNLALGEIAATQSRFVEAETRFEAVLARDPGSAEARKDMGILRLSQGRPGDARRWLEQAVAADEAEVEAWNGLGVARAQAGDLQGAVTAWRKAVALEPGLGDAWFNLAVTLRRLGDTAAARDALERYVPLAQGPDRARAEALLRQLGS